MRAGGVATCIKLNLLDASVAEIAGMCGFDCIWPCMEHVPSTLSDIVGHIRAAKMYDVDTMVRVKKGCYSDFVHPLEADAAGIMVPHLMSLKEAQEIVYFTRFHPIGRRPADGGNSDGAYCMLPFTEYIRQANEQRFIVVQIEDPEPLKELDQIAKVAGIDMLFFGPADFSQGIGAPGQFDHPKIAETRKRVAEVARANGKFAGTVGSPETFQDLADMGYQFINVGADVTTLGTTFRNIAAAIGKTKAGTVKSIY
jgi:4-hydroxy-2-oxoheptanedioate aldolase